MLGEGARTAADAARYEAAYAAAIETVGKGAKGAGPETGHGISVKLSALCPRYEATQEAIDLCDACVESLDHSGNPTAVTTDADCQRLLDAPGIRFTDVARSGRGGASTRSSDGAAAAAAVQVLLSPPNADSGDMAGGQGGFANVD